MKLISWNVNGLRACIQKGFMDFFNEQDADILIFLYRDDYYNPETETPGVCEINIAKHRSGPTGKIELTWVSRYTKFSDKAM